MKLAVWGANSHGQLGTGVKTELVAEPVVLNPSRLAILPELLQIKSLYGGGGHSLFLTNDGSVYGCGWNNAGQLLSDESTIVDFIKLPHLEEYKLIQLATKWDTCLGVTENGLCIGWGSNAYDQLGLPSSNVTKLWRPKSLAENVKQVACGGRHSVLLLRNGTVLSAGSSYVGRLGRDSGNPGFVLIPSLKDVKQVACGFNHSIALTEEGKIYGWGSNKKGQLGIDPKIRQVFHKPEELIGIGGTVSSVHCGWSSTHILTNDGNLSNFGRNDYGQLGQAEGPSLKPWDIHVLNGIEKISVGSEHALALMGEKFVSWGWNEHASCGNGSTENRYLPTDVMIEKRWKIKDFVAASSFNFALLHEN